MAGNKKTILANYQHIKEDDYFNFERIGSYRPLEDSQSLQQLSGHTLSDLDFDEFFMYADRTCSKVGQQFLYHQLSTIPKTGDRVSTMEQVINFYKQHPEEKENMVLSLHRLGKPSAYYLKNLSHDQHLSKPKWYPLIWI